MIEHTSDVSEAPKIACRAQRCRAHRTHKHLPIYASKRHTRRVASEPPPPAHAPQTTVSMASTAAPMVPVPAGTAVSKWNAAMGMSVGRGHGRWLQSGAWAREGSAWAEAGTAADGTPCRTITLPTFSRQSQEFFPTLFTATVKKPAHLPASRQMSRDGIAGEHAAVLRDRRAAATARPTRYAKAQLPAESRGSSTCSICSSSHASSPARDGKHGNGATHSI